VSAAGQTGSLQQTASLLMSSWKQWSTRLLRAFLYAFNIRSLWLCALSCLSVAVSQYLGLTYNVEFSFVALGITFPLTFNSK
jgi:hypothetical protein